MLLAVALALKMLATSCGSFRYMCASPVDGLCFFGFVSTCSVHFLDVDWVSEVYLVRVRVGVVCNLYHFTFPLRLYVDWNNLHHGGRNGWI